MAQQKESLEGKEDLKIEKQNSEDLSNVSQSPSQSKPDSPNLHCRLQRYMNKESSPIDIDFSNQCHAEKSTGIDEKYSTIPKLSVYENTMKMQNLTLQKADIQNADIANVLPRDSSSPQNLSQTGATEETALKYFRPPKLPFLNDIHQLKQKEVDMEQMKRNLGLPDMKSKNVHYGYEKTRPPIKGLPFLKEIERKINSKDCEKNNSEIQPNELNVMHTSPTYHESVYVKQKIKNDIAKYNEKRNLTSPSPKPELFSEIDQAIKFLHESSAPVKMKGFVPPKLPFLKDIHKLKKQEIELDQVQEKTELPRKNQVNAHIGRIENRPRFGVLPFLNDIKSLGQLKAKAERDTADTMEMPVTNARSHETKHETEFVKDKIKNDIAKYNENRNKQSPITELGSSQRNSFIDQIETSTIERDTLDGSGSDIIKGSLPITIPFENKKRNSPKVVRFSDEGHEQNLIRRKSSVYPHVIGAIEDDESFPSDPKAAKQKIKKPTKYNIKIDEKTSMSKLSDQIIPQLNTMQKNFLGLLFFNELSPNIVDDIVAQQLLTMPGTKLATVINHLEQQVCDTAAPILMESASEEVRTALVCDAFGEFKAQEKAAVVFTTGNDAMDVCSTVADFGGRAFKKALIKNMLDNEDKEFIDELFQDQCKLVPRAKESLNSQINVHGDRQAKYLNSEEDENYSSAEESIIEQIYQYQYFDFENN